ncbi:hypothetical protein DL771_005359 [Monosporascus sp. 5C6A]|nr:hypothetical protein DL771_005359 [Monosporascus sp. 5C6A]
MAPCPETEAGASAASQSKKKCDERRPQCARCSEKGIECTYEAVKPRQRKKRESQHGSANVHPTLRDSTAEVVRWHRDAVDGARDTYGFSPTESAQDDRSVFAFSPACDDIMSPVSLANFDWTAENDESQSRELIRRNSHSNVISQPRSLPPDLAMIAPSPVVSPTLEFRVPAFSEFSNRPNRRALVDHFCNVLSHLIVFREECGNPFQQLVLPLAHQSSPVMNAVYALASAHMEYRGVNTGEKSVSFHNRAIQDLARLIQREDKINKTELLAAIMLLVYYEVLVQRGRTNIVDGHLKGALTIMNSANDSSPTSVFLERAFRFYDVITALSLGTAPLSTAPAAGCLLPFPLDAPAASPLSNVDTLLGMSTTLWPIMHRLSNLLSLKTELEKAVSTNEVSKIAVLKTEFETTSQAIETALTQWQPCLPPNTVVRDGVLELTGAEESPDRPRLQSILSNAMAYRHSAFVYLYRTIYGYLPAHALVQKHAHAALHHCVETTTHKGPMGALLWPLFVAACEAINGEDRILAEKAFAEIEIRQGMTNIEQAWKVVREVWTRLDLVSAVSDREATPADLWRRVSAELGVNIVFG